MEYQSTFNASHESRTAGASNSAVKSVQAWKTRKNIPPTHISFDANVQNTQPLNKQAKTEILAELDRASRGEIGAFNPQFDNQYAYAPNASNVVTDANNAPAQATSESFQFEDVVDVINPLHHLPVVGMVYRGITGDTLHPMSQIIGGAIYGGPIGAVTGTINAISQVQTGKDVSDHALGLMGFKSFAGQTKRPVDSDNPIAQLNSVSNKIENNQPLENLPNGTIAFTNLGNNNQQYEHAKIADGRTAGTQIIPKRHNLYKQNFANQYAGKVAIQDFSESPKAPLNKVDFQKLAAYEPITKVSLSPMPPKQEF